MPYKLRKRDGQFCVVKKDDPDGDSLGCHASKEDALAQLSALYAKEPSASMSAIAAMAKKSDMSYNDIRTSLEAALNKNAPKNADGIASSCWIRDFGDDYVIYSEGYGPSSMYRQTYSIKDGAVALGDRTPVREKTTYVAVVQGDAKYSLPKATFSASDQWVMRDGKLFEAGDFPDKHFNMTPLELVAAVERFKASRPKVGVDLEHTPTVLDGKLGHVEDIWLDEDGVSLFGRVAFPPWLDNMLADGDRKVSATWDRTSKDLVGLALVLEPRITDAALMSAFSQQGGVTAPAAQPPASETQSGHVSIGGRLMAGAYDVAKAFWDAAFGSNNFTPEQLATILANASNGGPLAAPTGAQGGSTQPATTEAQPLGTAGTSSSSGQLQPVPVSTVVQYAQQAADANSQQAALRQQMETLQGQYIDQMAVAFADRQIVVQHKAMPNERDAIIAAFKQAAWDDYRNPAKVTFGKGVEGSRVDALDFVFACRPAHKFTTESVGEQDLGSSTNALFNKTTSTDKEKDPKGEAPASADEVQNLLALSNLGQAVLASKPKAS